MNIAFLASSLVSAYWNGAATYYRGITRALAERGHQIAFFEPDAFDRQKHRDLEDPRWARVLVYPADREGVDRALDAARGADLVIKASGVGVFDDYLEAAVLELARPGTLVAFWDVDAPATLDGVSADPAHPLRACIPRYDLVLTYGGGERVVRAYEALGARRCVPIYNALDPHTHHPVPARARFGGILGFLGNRLPDREERVQRFFVHAAAHMPDQRFVLGGAGWSDARFPDNVAYLGHVYTRHHNAFNTSPRAVLNVNRQSMAAYGFSPPTRVFEAAGAGACIITDEWAGIERFLEPGSEILVARDGDEVVEHLRALDAERARAIGARARARILAEHTYAHRAADVEAAISRAARDRANGARTARPRPLEASAGKARNRASAPARHVRAADPIGPLDVVILGLSITSSWGNGHATTYRALVRALAARGHRVLFLERDVPWYASSRDLPDPPYCRAELYTGLADLEKRFTGAVRAADLVIVGSYVPEGAAVGEWVLRVARGVSAFYDIDTPVTLAKLEARDFEYLAPDLLPRYDMYLSFTGGPLLEHVRRTYRVARALPLHCSVDPALHAAPGPRWGLRWDLGYMGTYSADRQPVLDRLLVAAAQRWPGGRFLVAGPLYPRDIEWPANVARIEHVPPAEHRGFYTAIRFALSITRRDMVRAGYSPSVRLFEAAACGTPIITDSWPGLETFFTPGHEILIARSADDVLGYLHDMPEQTRREVGERARRRVLAEHTAAHRAATLESYVLQIRAVHRGDCNAQLRARPSSRLETSDERS